MNLVLNVQNIFILYPASVNFKKLLNILRICLRIVFLLSLISSTLSTNSSEQTILTFLSRLLRILSPAIILPWHSTQSPTFIMPSLILFFNYLILSTYIFLSCSAILLQYFIKFLSLMNLYNWSSRANENIVAADFIILCKLSMILDVSIVL